MNSRRTNRATPMGSGRRGLRRPSSGALPAPSLDLHRIRGRTVGATRRQGGPSPRDQVLRTRFDHWPRGGSRWPAACGPARSLDGRGQGRGDLQRRRSAAGAGAQQQSLDAAVASACERGHIGDSSTPMRFPGLPWPARTTWGLLVAVVEREQEGVEPKGLDLLPPEMCQRSEGTCTPSEGIANERTRPQASGQVLRRA